MSITIMDLRFVLSFLCCSALFMKPCRCQQLTPLKGMAPSKWITIRHTMAPGKYYRAENGPSKKYTQEDCYVRAWVPVIKKDKFAIILGPSYRTEQLELKSYGDNPIMQLDGWKLRTMALDLKSFFSITDHSYLVVAGNINKSGNLTHTSHREVPLNYNITAAVVKKSAENKEIGAGIMIGRGQNLTVLPVFMLNYNLPSGKSGIEIALPKKIAYRLNLSPNDILYLKSEAMVRRYYTYGINDRPAVFRLIDIDSGVLYNRQINKLIGLELFGGYRMNISNRLPQGIEPVRTSGLSASVEIFVKPPFGIKKQ